MRLLYVDCFSGAAGDMFLGALIDAGVPLDDVRRALGSLAVEPDTIWTERVTRAGIRATRFRVRGEGLPSDPAHAHDHGHGHQHAHAHDAGDTPDHGDRHGHDHDHHHGPGADGHQHAHGRAHEHRSGQGHQQTGTAGTPARPSAGAATAEPVHHHAHRSLAEIERLIDGSALSAAGKRRARELFTVLGEAEAAVHGTSLDRVHLHEVGALDSIIDICGTVFALEQLGVDRIVSSPLNVGSGSIRSAHGLYPVPAPATIRLLRGVPIYAGTQAAELVTPTGALLVTGYASAFGPVPAMRVAQIGYGAGSRDFPDTPNVLRVLVGDADAGADVRDGRVVVLETEIDDMNPQIFGPLMDQLLAQGALDVFYTAVQMKKNRPGTLLTVVAAPGIRERLTAVIFRETTTIGIRYREMARECLDRQAVTVDTPYGRVRLKVARRDGEILNVSPEFDDLVRLAAEHDRPVKEIQALALTAFFDRRP